MKTILTIDFDIIMGPSIELYNNIVKEFRIKKEVFCYGEKTQ